MAAVTQTLSASQAVSYPPLKLSKEEQMKKKWICT